MNTSLTRLLRPIAALLIVLAAIPSILTSSSSTNSFATSADPIYWGAWVPSLPTDMSQQVRFESMTQKGASIIHWGQAWRRDGVFQPFYPGDFDAVRSHGSIPMLDWGSWNLGAGVRQPRFKLSAITAGTYDSYIRSWAMGAKNWGKPFFLRPLVR